MSEVSQTRSGVLEASSPAHVQQQLREKGLFALEVKSKERRKAAGMTPQRILWRGVPKREILALTSQLSIIENVVVISQRLIKLSPDENPVVMIVTDK